LNPKLLFRKTEYCTGKSCHHTVQTNESVLHCCCVSCNFGRSVGLKIPYISNFFCFYEGGGVDLEGCSKTFIEDQSYSRSYDFAPPLPHLPSGISTGDTQEDREKRQLAGGRGERRWVRSRIRRWRASLVFYRSFNTLWV
jgi:hypothetical protein